MADRPREARGPLPPRVRARELWRIPGAAAGGAGRRHAARDPRPGGGRARHRHRRRDPARELLQPLRHRARGRRPRQPRHRARPQRPSQPRAARRRPIRRTHAVEVEDLQFLRAHTDAPIKITVPGPFTMSQQAQNDYYGSREAAAMDYAAAVNEEIRDLFAAGADIVQIDEPYMQARPEKARAYGLAALNRALEGVTGTTAVHICFGYAAIIHRAAVGLLVPARARRLQLHQVSIETAQSKLDCSVLEDTAGQEDHARRARPRRHDGRDAGDRRGAHPPRAALRACRERHRRARLRHEPPGGGVRRIVARRARSRSMPLPRPISRPPASIDRRISLRSRRT